ncbi:N-acetylmuramoyl-L-alanine amidase family protein [Sphingobacterium bovistauri]|uniref:N-acetylmuramoyl-L-alanine amidase n=1 Tax=Sphingobacterium bovistauri TaxID=2781959 RepID=A0ABS7Z5F5_9SPHI|nr:N-acetylmuramoyl-L-alanine amidase [Sphingobacterium bovistauri]MCA5005421.1 N-acetylmuramoyl-L-alanine amidase [Sphingobacterium bovistauri]
MKFINSVKYISTSLLAAVLICTLSSSNVSPQEPSDPPKKTFTVVLDPGHGGAALGAVGRKSKEKDIVLDISLKLKKDLEEKLGINVLLTRSTDVDVAFRTRSEIANKNHADLFVSIHANSANNARRKNPQVTGTETLVLGFHRMNEQDVAIRENADMLLEDNYEENNADLIGFDPKDPSSYIVFKVMKRQYRDRSIRLASLIQNEFITSNRPNRGVKEQGLAVLSRASMPAVLTEIGFISSPTEEDYMLSEEGQAEIVKNLTEAIKNYKVAVAK